MSTSITKNFPVGQVHLLGFPPSSKVPTVGTLLISHILKYDFYIHIWSRTISLVPHAIFIRHNILKPDLVVFQFKVTSLPSMGGLTSSPSSNQKTPGQVQNHCSLLTSAHPVYISCTFSTEALRSFISPSSADHLFLYLVAVSPPTILLAINGLLPFNYPIF